MGTQVSPIFQALEDQARRDKSERVVFRNAALCRRAHQKADEIHAMRAERYIQRANSERRNDTNGTLTPLELHPLEWAACTYLCPELNTANSEALTRAWRWVLKQPWGHEFRASPFERTRF